MKSCLALLILLAAPYAAAAHAAETPCPALPDASELQWQFHRFDESSYSCYAVTGQNHLSFGFLVAPAFKFEPKASEQVATGRIGERSVNWYRTALQPTSWQSLLSLDSNPAKVVHVFVPASDASTLQQRLSVLESLSLAP